MRATTTCTSDQAWSILKRHARDEIAFLRLEDLCKDNDRVSSLVAVHNTTTDTSRNKLSADTTNSMLLIDLSRQRLTVQTLRHLLNLSVARGICKYIQRLAWGQNNPDSNAAAPTSKSKSHRNDRHAPHVPYQHYMDNSKDKNQNTTTKSKRQFPAFPHVISSMHLALRSPKDRGLHMLTLQGVNALTAIHRDWDSVERLSDSLRRGVWRGATGKMIKDVVVVGRGVSVQGLKFVYHALCHDEAAMMAQKFGLDTTSGSTDNTNKNNSNNDWAIGIGSISSAPGRLIRRGLASTGNRRQLAPKRRIHFLTSVDPLVAVSLVSELDPASTMVVTLALQGNEETGLATRTMKTWLLQQLGGAASVAAAEETSSSKHSSSNAGGGNLKADRILSKHMLLVTGNDQIANNINKPASVFVIPEHSRCEAFISFSVATLLPLSIVFGWSICEKFLDGGHDMDLHFVETNPRHNIPLLLALTDVWNHLLLGASSAGRIVTPFTQAMQGYSAFVAALEAHACASPNNDDNVNGNYISCSSLVMDGGSDGAYERALYQSPKIIHSEMVMVMNTQLVANATRNLGAHEGGMDQVFQHADALMCSFFGQADEMAFGVGSAAMICCSHDADYPRLQRSSYKMHQFIGDYNASANATHGFYQPAQTEAHLGQTLFALSAPSKGNRPSTLVMVQKLDAFACGQLVALSEHRATVKAQICDLDPFTKDSGHALKAFRTEILQENLHSIYETQEQIINGPNAESHADNNDECGCLNLSTKTMLGHYARVRN